MEQRVQLFQTVLVLISDRRGVMRQHRLRMVYSETASCSFSPCVPHGSIIVYGCS